MDLHRDHHRCPPRGRHRPFAGLATVVVVLLAIAGCSSDAGDERGSATTSTKRPAKSEALVIAHRGGSAYAPEHTFAAYDLALDQGADYLEQDLQLTADGVLVVLHDATLDRTARGPAASCTGAVADKTLAQIEECDVGSWFNEANPDRADPDFVGLRIPTLEQVLDRYRGDARYYIELKALAAGSGMEQPLLDVLARAELPESSAAKPAVFVQSFGPDVLRTVHGLRPDLPLVLLVPDLVTTIDPATLDDARGYATAIGPANTSVDATLVTAAHDRCLDVHPYTVDDPAEMERLLRLGVDGMFTDRPDVLRTALDGVPSPPEHCAPARG